MATAIETTDPEATPRTKKDIIADILRENPDATTPELAEAAGCDEGHAGKIARAWRTARVAGMVERLALDTLKLDMPTQMRPDISIERRDELADLLADGDDLDPIDVMRTPSGDLPTDGWHRIDLYLMLGRDTIPARVRHGSVDDALEEAARANSKGPLPRCDLTKRNAIATLMALPKYANATINVIAKAAGVSHKFAAKTIDDLTAQHAESPADVGEPLASNLAGRAASKTRTVQAANGSSYQTPAVRSQPVEESDESEPESGGFNRRNPEVSDSSEPSVPSPRDHGPSPEEEEIIASCPLVETLAGDQAFRFRDAVLCYLRTAPGRKLLGDLFRRHSSPPPSGSARDPYAYQTERYLRLSHPRDWVLCASCHGSGCSRRTGCHGLGFVMP